MQVRAFFVKYAEAQVSLFNCKFPPIALSTFKMVSN